MTTMEDLTKTQIVLLTLLVSFITSIATGIITTSLLAQAPQNVTETIDRVVERTIEKVAPAPAGAGGTVKEVTIVKEGDAMVASIEQASKAVVRIKTPADSGGNLNFYALGVVVSKTGLILSDKRELITTGTYTVVLPDGSTLPATVIAASDAGGLALFKLQTDDAHLKALTAIPVSGADPKLGQTVIAIEGKDKNSVAVGRVLSLDTDSGSALTDIPSASETQGGALLNLSGELVGLKSSSVDLTIPPSAYKTATQISKFIAAHS